MEIPFVSGALWKVATGGAALIALVLSALLMSSYFEKKNLSAQRDLLTTEINDPRTGYIAQLAQARTNEAQLKSEVDRQSAAYTKLSNDSAARLAEARRQLAAAQHQTAIMQKKLDDFMATKPQGATLGDRVQDIDRRAMKEFVK